MCGDNINSLELIDLKLAIYEAEMNGEIDEGQRSHLLWETENRELSAFEHTTFNNIKALNNDLSYMLLENSVDRVLVESEDAYFFEAKAKKVEQESKGILSRIINAIKSLFTKLKNWLTGKTVDPSEKSAKSVRVIAAPQAIKNMANKAFQNIDKIMSAVVIGTGTAAFVLSNRTTKLAKKLGKENHELRKELDNKKSELKYKNIDLSAAHSAMDAQSEKLQKLTKELKDSQAELKKTIADGHGKDTIVKSSYDSAMGGYREVIEMCEKKMDEINKVLMKPETHLNAELTAQLKSSFQYLQTLYVATQKSIKEIIKATGISSERANEISSRKPKDMITEPLKVKESSKLTLSDVLQKTDNINLDVEYKKALDEAKKSKDSSAASLVDRLSQTKNKIYAFNKQIREQKTSVLNAKSNNSSKLDSAVEKLQSLIEKRQKLVDIFNQMIDQI